MVASVQSMTSPYAIRRPAAVDIETTLCAACGVEHQAEWGMTLRCDRLRRHTAYFRLCDECKQALMTFLAERPDRGPNPLRGYT